MEEMIDNPRNEKSGVRNSKYPPLTCNLKPIRIALGMTQPDVARELGTTPNFVNMVEREKYYPNLEMRIKIAKVLKTDSSAIWIEIKEEVENESN